MAKEHRIEEEADVISTIPPIKGKISIKIIKIKVLVALIVGCVRHGSLSKATKV